MPSGRAVCGGITIGFARSWARSAGTLVDAPQKWSDLQYAIQAPGQIVALTVTADRATPQPPGTTITLTAAVTGGTAPVEFKSRPNRQAGCNIAEHSAPRIHG